MPLKPFHPEQKEVNSRKKKSVLRSSKDLKTDFYIDQILVTYKLGDIFSLLGYFSSFFLNFEICEMKIY